MNRERRRLFRVERAQPYKPVGALFAEPDVLSQHADDVDRRLDVLCKVHGGRGACATYRIALAEAASAGARNLIVKRN